MANWTAFNLKDALSGTLVGYKIDPDDLSNIQYTGQLQPSREYSDASYKVSLRGIKVWIDSAGTVIHSDDTQTIPLQTVLWLVTNVLAPNYSTKMPQTRAGSGDDDYATVSSTSPRDQFAMEILNAIIQKADNPADMDDASMISASNVAYRWAEAMMCIAANYRPNEASGSQETPDALSDSEVVVKNGVEVKNPVVNNTPVPLGVQVSNPTNSSLIVKGNDTYHPDDNPSNDIAGVLNVNVVAGGGGGTSSVDLDDLIGAMGYAKETVPVSGDTQADKFDALTTAVTNAGRLKSTDVDVVSDETQIAAVVIFKSDAVNPYKVTPYTLTKAMYTYFDGRYGLKLNNVSAPPSTYAAGNYYNFTSSQSGLSITLPALSVTGSNPVKIFIVRASITGTLTVTFSGTLKWRGSKQTSLNGEYEIDFIDNGTCWTVGVTEIVSN